MVAVAVGVAVGVVVVVGVGVGVGVGVAVVVRVAVAVVVRVAVVVGVVVVVGVGVAVVVRVAVVVGVVVVVVNTRNTPPGTLLLASSPCPFCGTPARLLADTASSGVKGWTVCCPAENKVCPIHPRIWRQDKAEAIAIWCRRKAA